MNLNRVVENVGNRIRTLAHTLIPSDLWSSALPLRQRQRLQLAKLCNLCEEHVNVINTVANPMIGGQLPNPNECNSTLTSETRGEMLTPYECHSTPTGGATYLILGGYVCRMTQNCDP